ncbi:MAG: sigma-70 family RNA polymerase sigma factor [bacterium]|nr:sigma-70 family RNA polymerase sigma factor [bacterium]
MLSQKAAGVRLRYQEKRVTALTDEELMQAYVEGDSGAFERLYARHKGRLFGYLVGRLNDHAEAEEVFQTVFFKLHRARASYRTKIPFLAWLFAIARNAVIDHLRREQVRRAHITVSNEAEAISPSSQPAQMPLNSALPEMASLSAAQRQVLELRFSEGMTFQEIAEQTQWSSTNARQLVSRAIRKLRKKLTGKERHHEEQS